MSCRLATTETEAPGARVSSTIRRFSSAVQRRRPGRSIPHQPWCPPRKLVDTITPRPLSRTGAGDRTLTIDVAALHLLERHFAPGLHEEILEAVGLGSAPQLATRWPAAGFRAAVLEAYFAECCVCGFSLRLVDGLIGVDAAQTSRLAPTHVPALSALPGVLERSKVAFGSRHPGISVKRAGILIDRTVEDADCLMARILVSAARIHDWIAAQTGDPLDMLRRMKFETVGFHPIEGHPLNLVEQINQTWPFAVALAAARQLLLLHPDAGGFHLAPGANAAFASGYHEPGRGPGRC